MENKVRELLWHPSVELQESTNLTYYQEWLHKNKALKFDNYEQLWTWSVSEIEEFWTSILEYFSIDYVGEFTNVVDYKELIDAKWFEGIELNYTQNILKNLEKDKDKVAIIYESEVYERNSLTWGQLYQQVASVSNGLKKLGVKKGDRIASYSPNIPETVITFLACASLGAIWSSTSPDFGSHSAIERFKQIKPKLLLAVNGYRYNGKDYSRLQEIKTIQNEIESIEKVILIPYVETNKASENIETRNDHILWDSFIASNKTDKLTFTNVGFNDPLWILYSSGTTGIPKAIVQSQGGILIEHLKNGAFHLDLKQTDKLFWYTTTGWMVWNIVISGLLLKTTIVLYDGNPAYPDLDKLWELIDDENVTIFGTSPNYLSACMKNNVIPKDKYPLKHLKAIGMTGSPLQDEGYRWVYQNVKDNLWLFSTSGGTDICSGFVGGNPNLPVYVGEIQSRSLGAPVEAFDEHGNSLKDEIGELVLTKPMPSMPIYFWNDEKHVRYRDSYYDVYPNVWRHGDFIKITSEGNCLIYGRSDATINRGGIRIGTSEIYNVVEEHPRVIDSLVVEVPQGNGVSKVKLFIVLKDNESLTESLKEEIIKSIQKFCTPRHVPDEIISVKDIPRTLNGKKMEVPIKKILMGEPWEKVINIDSLANPDSIKQFV